MNMFYQQKKTSRGFTLIELVMVIVILGVLAAVALPKFIDLSNEARLGKVLATRGAIVTASYNNFVLKRSGVGSAVTVDGLVCTKAVMESLLGSPLPSDLVVAEKVGTCEGPATTMATCLMTDNNGAWATGIYCAH